ncbi:MAG: hypothetical protein JW395_1503 [Nitrospira sp.]|nr:hypothetical protein [Nitrospira sp.]
MWLLFLGPRWCFRIIMTKESVSTIVGLLRKIPTNLRLWTGNLLVMVVGVAG